MKRKIVFLTGAGVSAESGINTFRDSNGLWENHNVMDVASIQGWSRNKELVLEFYNQRRRQLKDVEPNLAHKIIAELEGDFDVTIITQNVDNLHERGGSTNVIHLHGELTKMCSSYNKEKGVMLCEGDINLGDKHEDGSQLRPYIVWFGEDVPKISMAADIVETADILVVIGTSLNVYPAAGLIEYSTAKELYLIDPNPPEDIKKNFEIIQDIASSGMIKLKEILLKNEEKF